MPNSTSVSTYDREQAMMRAHTCAEPMSWLACDALPREWTLRERSVDMACGLVIALICGPAGAATEGSGRRPFSSKHTSTQALVAAGPALAGE